MIMFYMFFYYIYIMKSKTITKKQLYEEDELKEELDINIVN